MSFVSVTTVRNYLDNPSFIKRLVEGALIFFVAFIIFSYIKVIYTISEQKNDEMYHQFLTHAGYMVQQDFINNPIELDQTAIWDLEAQYATTFSSLDARYNDILIEEAETNSQIAERDARAKEQEKLIEDAKNTFEIDLAQAKVDRDNKALEDTRTRFGELLAVICKITEKQGPIFFAYDNQRSLIYTPDGYDESFNKALKNTLLYGISIDEWRAGSILLTTLDSDLIIGTFIPQSFYTKEFYLYVERTLPGLFTILIFGCTGICWIQVYVSFLITKTLSRRKGRVPVFRQMPKNIVDGGVNNVLSVTEARNAFAQKKVEGQQDSIVKEEEYLDSYSNLDIWDNIADNLDKIPYFAKNTSKNTKSIWDKELLPELPGKNAFEDVLRRIWQSTRINHNSLYVVRVNIDRMSRYNDEHGYMYGNELLQAVTDLLRKVIDHDGFYARFPGDEFVIVLIETSKVAVDKRVQKIIDAVNKLLHDYTITDIEDENNIKSMSASIGYGVLLSTDESVDTVYKNTQTALCVAKERMRGEAVCFSDINTKKILKIFK